MSLKKTIFDDIKTAMKNKDIVAKNTLRVLKGEIERAEQSKDGRVELTDEQIVAIVKKSLHGVRMTSCDPEEIAVLEKYIPAQLTEDEMRTYTEKFIKTQGIKDMSGMGDVMKHFKDKFDGQYDGKTLSGIVKEMLS